MKDMYKISPVDKVKEILRVKNWKQKELAKQLGVSEKTVSHWMNKRKKPSREHEIRIGKLYAELYGDLKSPSEVRATAQEYQGKAVIDEVEKVFTVTEQTYYTAKCFVKEREKSNTRYVYLFPSISKEPDAWYKIGGRSLFFYKTILAPRLEREAKLRDDTDKVHLFRGGIVSVRWGSRLIAEAEGLGYKAERMEYGVIVIDLLKDFTEEEIRGMRDMVRAERTKLKKLINPKENYPKIMIAMNDLMRVLPSKIKKLDKDYKGILGEELLEPMVEMLKIYFRFANGRMEKQDAKLEMLERVDDISAMIYLMDECQMLNVTARTMMGENVVKIRKSIEESL